MCFFGHFGKIFFCNIYIDCMIHSDTEINEKENFECQICHKVFKTNGNLAKHIKKKNQCHPVNEEKYKCGICSKIFQKKSHYNDHMNKKFPCKHHPLTEEQIGNIFENKIDKVMNTMYNMISLNKEQAINDSISANTQNIISDSNNTTNNTTNNTNSNNTNTNTMNNMTNTCLINYVVAQYPNAKNIEDCIKIENIPRATLTECEDLYFTDGAMKIFKGLCDLGEENRPIHCTDASRCNYIYKSNDVWKIDVGGEAIRNHFFPVIQEAYTQVHKNRIKNNPGNSTIIGNYLTEMTGTNVKKICQKTLKKLSNDFLAKNSKNSKLIKMQDRDVSHRSTPVGR
jgi:uncharacterized C2H2 Zn-finger protein